MSRVARCLCAALLCVGVSATGLPAASAADGALLRLAHLSPDTPAVDVYVDSVADTGAGVVLTGVAYGTISDYQDVAPGAYTVAMRAAGDDVSTPPVLSTTVEVGASSARTVAGVGYFATLGLEVLEDDLTLPPAGQVRMRVVAAAAAASTMDVSRTGGAELASGLDFAAATDYVDIPAGRTSLEVTPEGGTTTTLPVDLTGGAVYSVLVLDQDGGGLRAQTVLDAASPGAVPVGADGVPVGPGVVPAGGVDAGAGGDAGTFPVVLAAVGVSALASVGLLVSVGDRLPRRGRSPRHRAPALTRPTP